MESLKAKRDLTCLQSNYSSSVADRFGQAAATYQVQASLQRHSAKHLLDIITTYQPCVPDGSIIEVGCGTGFITQGLLQTFPQRQLEITDLSTEMLNFCRSYVSISDRQQHLVSFQIQDGEKLFRPQKYAAIVSGFVIQWFDNPVDILQKWFAQIKPGGFLFLSFPTRQSFSEWRQICIQNHIPFTANPLPDPVVILQSFTDAQIRHQEVIQTVDTYTSAAVFFRGLKAIGAGLNQTKQRLSIQQMKQLIQGWDTHTSNYVKVSHHTMFLVIQK
jgi:malonyl-CoA O-methyltransferase